MLRRKCSSRIRQRSLKRGKSGDGPPQWRTVDSCEGWRCLVPGQVPGSVMARLPAPERDLHLVVVVQRGNPDGAAAARVSRVRLLIEAHPLPLAQHVVAVVVDGRAVEEEVIPT